MTVLESLPSLCTTICANGLAQMHTQQLADSWISESRIWLVAYCCGIHTWL